MSDALKDIYAGAGLPGKFFEGATPVTLWRAQSRQDFKKQVFLMEPHPGYVKKDKVTGEIVKRRLPDVEIVERHGKQIVKGCRCVSGDYRGISVYDVMVTWLGSGWMNYEIPEGTEIPENLAVTRDHYIRAHKATHYTLAPKDDMPLELFLASLKVVADKAIKK